MNNSNLTIIGRALRICGLDFEFIFKCLTYFAVMYVLVPLIVIFVLLHRMVFKIDVVDELHGHYVRIIEPIRAVFHPYKYASIDTIVLTISSTILTYAIAAVVYIELFVR